MRKSGAVTRRVVDAVGITPILIATVILFLDLGLLPSPGGIDGGIAVGIGLALIALGAVVVYLGLVAVLGHVGRSTRAVLIGWVCMAAVWAVHGWW